MSSRCSMATLILLLTVLLATPARAELVEDETLKGAKLGDWIQHRLVMPPELKMESSTKQTLVKMTADTVELQMETTQSMNGQPLPPQKQSMTRQRKLEKKSAAEAEKAAVVKPSEETIKAADGKEYKCQVYETVVAGKKNRTWICKDLPFGGLVRTEADGKIVMEMIGWGRGK